MALRDRFSDQELAAVRDATRAAEALTGGELVCVIVDRCDAYEAAAWRAGLWGAIAGSLVSGLGNSLTEIWGPPWLPVIVLPPLLGAAAGWLLVTVWPTLRRLSVPAQVLDRRVDRRAAQAFLEEEIFATRDRTGLLLFVALFEHRIRILPDRGVADRVPATAWDQVARALAEGLRTRDRGQALVDAVTTCGRLLVEHGVARRLDDEDELDDRPRLYDD